MRATSEQNSMKIVHLLGGPRCIESGKKISKKPELFLILNKSEHFEDSILPYLALGFS